MKSTVSQKGQVTIPKEVRRELGLKEGTPVEFVPQAGGVLLRKRMTGPHPVDQVFGMLKLGRGVDRTLKEMREGRSGRG